MSRARSKRRFNPSSEVFAGLTFWGSTYAEVNDANGQSTPESAMPDVHWTSSTTADGTANAQVNIALLQSDGTMGAPFGLLGSSLDSGLDVGTQALPGSVLMGGTGKDWLIGNSGSDTFIGGQGASYARNGNRYIDAGTGNATVFVRAA